MKKLTEYEKKRDFDRTPEPSGEAEAEGEQLRFVVQEHHATRLHWDLRLEHEGALASWAVPNGIPEDPKENRKAVHTEDHPLEYLTFEGDIPEGNYGAGKMTIWDRGTYELHKWEPRKVVLTFHGERLEGRYSLFQAGKSEKDWLIHRMDPPADSAREPMLEHVVPMLARLGELPAKDSDWAYEIKWDGVRAITYSEPGRLRLESRNLNDITAQYPEVRGLNRALSSHSAVLDGELVAFDAEGRPSFERLQQRMHLTGETQIRRRAQDTPVVYVIFDVLYLDGHSLMELPYTERRARLEELGLEGPAWQTPGYAVGGGAKLLEATAKQGLEGIMAKRLDCPYEPGKRAAHWIKVKTKQRQEFVVGGWLTGEGRRSGEIGALLLGYFEDGEFRFAGKVGTGFGEKELKMLARELAPLEREASPFARKQPQKGARFAEPKLVAEIEFTEWTKEGMLRHPSYKGLRDDKPAEQVLRELAQEPPPPEPERKIRRTNVDKVLFPATGFTKGELIAYYERMGEVILPHLHGRLVSVKRYPNGVEGKKWWERDHRIDDLPTLLEFANKAAIELHPMLHGEAAPDRPSFLVFDLDPGPPAGIRECCTVAAAVRGMLAQLGLESFPKTSGGKGLQVYVPLGGDATYAETKPFAKAVAETMENGMRDLVVSRMTKKLREGKVLVDWGQNDPSKSMVCAYALRGKERPTVSMPVAWEELEDPNALSFEWNDALERVERDGDIFAPVLTLGQRLPAAQ